MRASPLEGVYRGLDYDRKVGNPSAAHSHGDGRAGPERESKRTEACGDSAPNIADARTGKLLADPGES
jgi:hypothetical protein